MSYSIPMIKAKVETTRPYFQPESKKNQSTILCRREKMAKSKNVVSGKKSQTRYSTWQPIGSFRKCRDVKYQKDPIPRGKE
jgi:hypothetical protein